MSRPALTPDYTVPAPKVRDAGAIHDGSGVEALARSLWGTSRDTNPARRATLMEALAGMAVNIGQRDGRRIASVALDPGLFACRAGAGHDAVLAVDSCDPAFAMALRIARRTLAVTGGAVLPMAKGATRFHSASENPAWACDRTPVLVVDDFLFYRD